MSLHRKARELRRDDYIEIGTRVYRVFAYARFQGKDGTERHSLLLFLHRPRMGEPITHWITAHEDQEFRVCPFEPGPV